MDFIIQQWKAKDELFVDTYGYKALIKALNTEFVAIVTGSPGCGKSCTAQHALFSLSSAGYDVIPVTSSTDMLRYFCRQNRQVFYIDDFCGKYNISSYYIDEWERDRDRISDIFTSPLTKCIFTCRLQIFKDPNFVNLNLATVKVLDLSGSHQLTLKEKISVGKKYLQEDILKCLGDEIITKSECFPLLCSLYDKHLHESSLFFEKPKTYFDTELDELKRKPDKLKYACIALCVMFNGKVPHDIFTQSSGVKASNRLKVTLENCEVNTSTPRKTILSQFESMVGSYFQKSKRGYKSIHDYMFDIYCSHVSTSMLQCIVEHADSRLLRDRALLQSLGEDNHQFALIIPATIEVIFFKRIVEDIKNSKIWNVFSSRQMKFAAYRSALISFIQNNKEIINNTDKDGVSALYVASKHGYIDIVEMLCNRGGNVNQCKKDERTPLYIASYKGHGDIVEMLCNRGGNVNQCDKDGYSPIHAASYKGHGDIIEMLCNRGGNVNQHTKDGRTPLYSASYKGHGDIVEMLCNRGGNVNQYTKDGRTPLYAASYKGHTDIVKMLCNRGGNVNQCTKDGRTPLYVASRKGNSAIVDMLYNRGGIVNQCTKDRHTPLHVAPKKGHSDIVDKLCNTGGNATIYSKFYEHVSSQGEHSNNGDVTEEQASGIRRRKCIRMRCHLKQSAAINITCNFDL